MKVKLNLLCGTLLLAAGTYLSGCTDKGTTPGVPQVSKGEPIQFSVGTAAGAESRTEYVDSFLLDWNVGDQVRIQCDRTELASADYQIVPATSDQWGSLSPVDTSQVLKWGEIEINDTYKFYAAYPAGRVMDETDGAFSMEYITNQLDTVVSLSNGAYLTNPDMNNAYMMAMKTVKMDTAKHHVRLDFDPIMTTFDITVRAGKYEVATGIINPVTVTGVSVIMPQKIDSDRFIYNAKGGTTSDKGSVEASDGSQSVYVGVRNGTSRYVDLHEGETLNLMAFLPPVDMNNGDVKMMVHTTAMNYVLTVPGDQITKQNKYFIQLPDMSPYDSAYNDWISELDSTTLLTQMSIPAYVCTGEETADEITALLKKGIRAMSIDNFFDPGAPTSFIHPIYLKKDVADISVPINDFLKNSEDFLIVWFNDGSLVEQKLDASDYLNAHLDNPFNSQWSGVISNDGVISELLKKKLIVLKQNTHYREGGYFIGEDDYPAGGSFGKDKTNYFPYNTMDQNYNLSSTKWGANFIDDISMNQTLYEYISTYSDQTGRTGIVTIPYAKDTYVNGQYTYSDLLIQSIIDCNFKFRH